MLEQAGCQDEFRSETHRSVRVPAFGRESRGLSVSEAPGLRRKGSAEFGQCVARSA